MDTLRKRDHPFIQLFILIGSFFIISSCGGGGGGGGEGGGVNDGAGVAGGTLLAAGGAGGGGVAGTAGIFVPQKPQKAEPASMSRPHLGHFIADSIWATR